jgi:hypothetical protein
MGEAKRRKLSDPTYGRNPNHGRGLVISAPMEVDVDLNIVKFRSASLDPQELRFALLFWDTIVWPFSTLIQSDSTRDEQFLQDIGILCRPTYYIKGEIAEVVTQTQVLAFLDLDRREPGRWAIAQGDNALLLKDHVLEVGRGALVELHRAIPVPDKVVPLDDILKFRVKRRDELTGLRMEIDSFFGAIDNAADKQFEIQRHIQRIDAACAAILRIGREWGFPLRLSDLKSSFELRPFTALMAGAAGWEWGAQHEMPLLSAALGAGVSTLKIGKDFGMRRLALRSSPYRYVYQFHHELF